MKLRLTLALWLSAVMPALAQPAPKQVAPDDTFDKDLDSLFVAGGLTSDQAANRAGKTSPDVLHRAAEIETAIADAETAQYSRIPLVGGRASYTRLSALPSIIVPIMGFPPFVFLQNQYVLEGTATIPLSDYLYRFPKFIDSTRTAVEASKTSQSATMLSAGLSARQAYYEWVRARLQVLVAQRQLTQVQTTLTQVRALAEVQRLSRADLMRVESQEAEAEQTLDVLTNLAQLREEQLRIQIGARDDEQLTIGEDIRKDVATPAPLGLEDMVKEASHKRLDLRSLDQGIHARELQRQAEHANQFPTLSAFGAVDYSNPNPRVFPQSDKFTYTWQVGVQLQWTLNGTLVSKAQEDKIVGETDELRADRENLRRGIRVDVLNAQQQVQIARHALVTTQKGLAAAEESYRVRRELLNAERATAVELVDSETDLTRAQIAALNAKVDLRVALAQLAHALGNDYAK